MIICSSARLFSSSSVICYSSLKNILITTMPLRIRAREHAPLYSQHSYPYIQRGFIMPHFKLYDAIETYFLPNNETANVYTQLFGLLAFAYLLLTVHLIPNSDLINTNEYKNLTADDIEKRKEYFGIALGSVILCMFSSLCYHMFNARNKIWHDFLTVCDWSGILVVGFGICVATDLGADFTQLIDNHTDSPFLQDILIWLTGPFHFVLVCVWITVSMLYLNLAKTSHGARLAIFASAIIFACLPGIFVGLMVQPLQILFGGFLIFLGGFFFASHLPEIKYRNTFDICCPSHCLWHTFYELSLIVIFDVIGALFFGQSPFTWENCARSAKFLIENFMVVLV